MKPVKDYILKDVKLKALSLILATMLWFAISNIGESKMTISVPVVAENMGKEFTLEKIGADAVLVTINGPISILKNLRARDIKVAVDLSGMKEGTHVFSLAKNNVTAPKGIRVEEVRPDYMAVNIDRTVEKRLKVVVILDEKWADTYAIRSWHPQYVRGEGPSAALKDKDVIETAPVNGAFRHKEEEVDVPLASKGMGITKLKPETVRVRLRRE
jgi:YbbR domain-containing protein